MTLFMLSDTGLDCTLSLVSEPWWPMPRNTGRSPQPHGLGIPSKGGGPLLTEKGFSSSQETWLRLQGTRPSMPIG